VTTENISTARRYASAVYAVVMCLSVRPSVRHMPYCIETAKWRIMWKNNIHSLSNFVQSKALKQQKLK